MTKTRTTPTMTMTTPKMTMPTPKMTMTTTTDATPAVRVAYLHGFASSPDSRKGTLLAERFAPRGVVVHRPDLRRPSFARLSHGAMLGALDELDRSTAPAAPAPAAPWVLVGSSLGGHLAALWAAQHPERVRALLLLCPAFDLPGRWPRLRGAPAMARWEREGTLLHDDETGTPQPLHWGFFAEACQHDPWPQPPAPCVVVHGHADVVVPLSSSERFVAAAPERRRLVAVADDHELASSIDVIERELLALLVGGGTRG
jgi:pimeloyl-ACP methyl ester carboxylesterase